MGLASRLLWLAVVAAAGTASADARLRRVAPRLGAAVVRQEVTQAQPLRCMTSTCLAFGAKCLGDTDCVTNKCYKGACASGASCTAMGKMCHVQHPQGCCSGECRPVTLEADCLRMIGVTDKQAAIRAGLNLQRQCESVGQCLPPPTYKGPPVQAEPWAIKMNDSPTKYYSFKDVTFSKTVMVDVARFSSRRMGRGYQRVDPATQKPFPISDAGSVKFVKTATVDITKWGEFRHGDAQYCVAPILRAGAGGGFYAIGQNCCNKVAGFACALPEDAEKFFGLVLTSGTMDANQYMNARNIVDNKYGSQYHDSTAGKGVETQTPVFVKLVASIDVELKNPLPLTHVYTAAAPSKITYCVAPLVSHPAAAELLQESVEQAPGVPVPLPLAASDPPSAPGGAVTVSGRSLSCSPKLAMGLPAGWQCSMNGGRPFYFNRAVFPAQLSYAKPGPGVPTKPEKTTANFWAVGTDCCDGNDGFACGPVQMETAQSGHVTDDLTGELGKAVRMAEIQWDLGLSQTRPLFVEWADGALVPSP